jgi:hypothetical protein
MPTTAQSFSTEGDRKFFDACLHEVFHVLGISRYAFPYWLIALFWLEA